jgi:hypothetical protein
MSLQNRVDPFGELLATPARGTLMGNCGGKFHTDDQKLTTRRWVSRQWICCVLDFKGRQRDVWGRYYTELFFLDEVTAFAAGHRPCFECRRKDAEAFASRFPRANLSSARPRASGDPGAAKRQELDSRVRGNERRGSAARPSARDMDNVLHAERLNGKAKRIHRLPFDSLPDGAFVSIDGEAYAVRDKWLLAWTPNGYSRKLMRPGGRAEVLTPPSIIAVLKAGYRPQWHPSAVREGVTSKAARPRASGDPGAAKKKGTGFPLSRE